MLHFVLLLPGGAFGLDPEKSVFQFNCQSWTRQNGLPADKVNTITQTKDGCIWLGTQNGLVNFDGLEFKVVAVDLPQAHGQDVRSVCRSEDGGLWFAINDGAFGRYAGKQFFGIADARWNREDFNGIMVFEARDRAIWTAGEFGLGRVVMRDPSRNLLLEHSTVGIVLSVCEDPAGRIWFGTVERGLFCWADGKLASTPDESLKKRNIFALAADTNGLVWVGSGHGLVCYDSQGQSVETPPFYSEVKALLVDRHGVLWVGTAGKGLARYQDGAFTYLTKSDGLTSDYITSLFEDAEGSLWIGTRDGLNQLSDLKFPIFSRKEGLSEGSGHAVCASRRGGLWLTTSSGATYFNGKTIQNFTNETLLPNRYVKSVFEAKNGDVYLVDGDKNLIVLSNGSLLRRLTNQEWPTAFAEDAESVLVGIGSQTPLMRIKDGELHSYLFKNGQEPEFYWINSMCVARDGALWVASKNGIFRIKEGSFEQWSPANGLSGPVVRWICEDADGSIWAGLATGIARIKDGALVNITRKQGLIDERIYAIVPDDHGSFWIASGRGILRVSRQSMNDCADGRSPRVACELFDGLESIKFNDRTDQDFSGCKTLDGRIWLPCQQGAVMIDPERYFKNSVPPPVRIQDVWVDGKPVKESKSLNLSAGAGRIEFYFSALSYISPRRIQIRYRLEGFDPDWVDAGTRRSVLYNKLKAGNYVFRVQACNADGVWNAAGASFGIVLPPPYYETPWFRALCGIAGLLALFGVYRWKVHRMVVREQKLLAEKDLLEAKVAERTGELATANQALRQEVVERARAEERIQVALDEQTRSLSLLNATIESTPDGILASDLSGKVVCSNTKILSLLGVPAQLVELGAQTHIERWAADQTANPEAYLKLVEDRNARPENEAFDLLSMKDGRTFERYLRPQRIGNQCVGRVILYRDITERKRAEAELAYERELLRALLDHSPDSIFFKDLKSRLVKASLSEIHNLFRVALHSHRIAHPSGDPAPLPPHLESIERFKEYILGKSDADSYRPEMASAFARDEDEILRTGQPIIGKIEKTTFSEGNTVWRLTTKMPWRDSNGNLVGTFGISKDISDLKVAEAKAEEAHNKLLEVSRQAGMAEVATSVLHNVGNVLNSINVSATLVADQVKKSRITYVSRVAGLLSEHAQDLGGFMTADPKGSQLPAYITRLAQDLGSEQAAVLKELGDLQNNIEHVKEIVSMQQDYAQVSGVTQSLIVTDLVEDALRLDESALLRHKVQVIREYQPDPPKITVDKHKAMQILINLIRNAKIACLESNGANKRMIVRTAHAPERVTISVTDNGVGIPRENLIRIFNHGFTTRKNGHGFGLHNGALSARQMGGQLRVHSDGPGQGSTFTLELPLHP